MLEFAVLSHTVKLGKPEKLTKNKINKTKLKNQYFHFSLFLIL